MKEKLDRFQHGVVAFFATISLVSSGIQPCIKLVKDGFSSAFKETGLQSAIYQPPPKVKHKTKQ
jgi:hypothetical protein